MPAAGAHRVDAVGAGPLDGVAGGERGERRRRPHRHLERRQLAVERRLRVPRPGGQVPVAVVVRADRVGAGVDHLHLGRVAGGERAAEVDQQLVVVVMELRRLAVDLDREHLKRQPALAVEPLAGEVDAPQRRAGARRAHPAAGGDGDVPAAGVVDVDRLVHHLERRHRALPPGAADRLVGEAVQDALPGPQHGAAGQLSDGGERLLAVDHRVDAQHQVAPGAVEERPHPALAAQPLLLEEVVRRRRRADQLVEDLDRPLGQGAGRALGGSSGGGRELPAPDHRRRQLLLEHQPAIRLGGADAGDPLGVAPRHRQAEAVVDHIAENRRPVDQQPDRLAGGDQQLDRGAGGGGDRAAADGDRPRGLDRGADLRPVDRGGAQSHLHGGGGGRQREEGDEERGRNAQRARGVE